MALEVITSHRRHININSRQGNVFYDGIALWILWEERHIAHLGAGRGVWKKFRQGFLEALTSELNLEV